jgi:hypothetical protein
VRRIQSTLGVLGFLALAKLLGLLPTWFNWQYYHAFAEFCAVVLIAWLVRDPVTKYLDREVPHKAEYAKWWTLHEARKQGIAYVELVKKTGVSVSGNIVGLSKWLGECTLEYTAKDGNRVHSTLCMADVDEIRTFPGKGDLLTIDDHSEESTPHSQADPLLVSIPQRA